MWWVLGHKKRLEHQKKVLENFQGSLEGFEGFNLGWIPLHAPPLLLRPLPFSKKTPALTASRWRPPVMDHGPTLPTRCRVCLQHLAEDRPRPIAQAQVQQAIAIKVVRLHYVVTCPEGPLEGFFDDPTIVVPAIKLLLLLFTHWACSITIIPTNWVVGLRVSTFPVFGPCDDGSDIVTSIGDVIKGLEVEIPTEATDVAEVAAGEVDQEVPVPVVGDPKTKICLQSNTEPTGTDPHLPICQENWEQCRLPIHLPMAQQSQLSQCFIFNIHNILLQMYPDILFPTYPNSLFPAYSNTKSHHIPTFYMVHIPTFYSCHILLLTYPNILFPL